MASTPWSAEEDRILRAYFPDHGSSWRGWQEVLPGRSSSAIRNRVSRLGIHYDPFTAHHSWSVEERAVDMSYEGMPISRIASELGVSEDRVRMAIVGAWADERERHMEAQYRMAGQ